MPRTINAGRTQPNGMVRLLRDQEGGRGGGSDACYIQQGQAKCFLTDQRLLDSRTYSYFGLQICFDVTLYTSDFQYALRRSTVGSSNPKVVGHDDIYVRGNYAYACSERFLEVIHRARSARMEGASENMRCTPIVACVGGGRGVRHVLRTAADRQMTRSIFSTGARYHRVDEVGHPPRTNLTAEFSL